MHAHTSFIIANILWGRGQISNRSVSLLKHKTEKDDGKETYIIGQVALTLIDNPYVMVNFLLMVINFLNITIDLLYSLSLFPGSLDDKYYFRKEIEDYIFATLVLYGQTKVANMY
jgi:hypothetical protein